MTQSDQIILYYVTGNADGQDNVESGNAKEIESEGVSSKRVGEVFRCQFCPSTFDRELGLYGHLNSHKVVNFAGCLRRPL